MNLWRTAAEPGNFARLCDAAPARRRKPRSTVARSPQPGPRGRGPGRAARGHASNGRVKFAACGPPRDVYGAWRRLRQAVGITGRCPAEQVPVDRFSVRPSASTLRENHVRVVKYARLRLIY